MATQVTHSCDRCGVSYIEGKDKVIELFEVGIHLRNSYMTFPTQHKASWCRACSIAVGIIGDRQNEQQRIKQLEEIDRKEAKIAPTLEDIFREIIREELQEHRHD